MKCSLTPKILSHLTHGVLVFGFYFKHYRFEKNHTMFEVPQGNRGKLFYQDNFLYEIRKPRKKYICNAIVDAVQEL